MTRIMDKKVAIIGYGKLGRAQEKLFKDCVVYDKNTVPPWSTEKRQKEANQCDYAIVCVWSGFDIDYYAGLTDVEEVLGWCECPIIIVCSTMPLGMMDKYSKLYNKRLVYEPEYIGETVGHPLADLSKRDFIILGGDRKDISEVVKLYQTVYNSNIRIYQTDFKTAELCKLMENSWIGTKVLFCNEIYDIAQKFGVDYNELRELWLADKRVSRSHTFVYPDNRGFGGKCVPKDMTFLAEGGQSKFFEFVLNYNEGLKNGKAMA